MHTNLILIIMTKTLIHQFLLDNDALGKFIIAYHDKHGYEVHATILGYFDSCKDTGGVINGAFTWSNTEGGSNYWSDLDNAFRNYFRENYN